MKIVVIIVLFLLYLGQFLYTANHKNIQKEVIKTKYDTITMVKTKEIEKIRYIKTLKHDTLKVYFDSVIVSDSISQDSIKISEGQAKKCLENTIKHESDSVIIEKQQDIIGIQSKKDNGELLKKTEIGVGSLIFGYIMGKIF